MNGFIMAVATLSQGKPRFQVAQNWTGPIMPKDKLSRVPCQHIPLIFQAALPQPHKRSSTL